MKKFFLMCSLSFLLFGCAVQGMKEEKAEYGLGSRAPVPSPLLRSITVSAAAWLQSQDMVYRLKYQDGNRRMVYSRSRWQASPAEMLQRHLAQALTGEGEVGTCRLKLELDVFEQSFDSPVLSRGVIEARALLLPAGTGAPLARQSFLLAQAAGEANAQGGVAALNLAANDLAQSLAQWLHALPAAQPCRER